MTRRPRVFDDVRGEILDDIRTSPEHLILTHWLPFVVLAPAAGYLLALFSRDRR